MLKSLELGVKTENIQDPGAAEMLKKKKEKKKGVPDRWLDYCPVGLRIPGTRFIVFKVPLKPSLNCRVPESDSFGLWDLLDSLERQDQELGLIIDLTFTTRYYKLTDVPQSWSYIKILTTGHQVPCDATILSFKRAVRQFLKENRDNDKLIGVHCTHGLNRTGYLVCRYLIDVDGLDPAAAVELFNSCRGHRIERQNYLEDLQRGAERSNDGIDEPEEEPTRGLAVERPPRIVTTREERRPLGSDRKEERPPSSDDPPEETRAANEKQRAGSCRRGARRRRKGDKSRDRAPQSSILPTPPSQPPPPLPSYVWTPAPQPTAPQSKQSNCKL